MIDKFISRGIPKCSSCIYYRVYRNSNKNEIESCIKFLSVHHKPISAEVARNEDLLCGYNAVHHHSGKLNEPKPEYILESQIIYGPGV
jgi:hypothetical protein